jgi:hypothetical protein
MRSRSDYLTRSEPNSTFIHLLITLQNMLAQLINNQHVVLPVFEKHLCVSLMDSIRPLVRHRSRHAINPLNEHRLHTFNSNLVDKIARIINSLAVSGRTPNRQHRTTQSSSPSVASLENMVFVSASSDIHNLDSNRCGICYDTFSENQSIVKTTCCLNKFMHINCATQVLRMSTRCPFCRHTEINFSTN